MSNFEQRWDEAYSAIKEQNKVNFGVLADTMNQGLLQFKPVFELFYIQGIEDYVNNKEGEK